MSHTSKTSKTRSRCSCCHTGSSGCHFASVVPKAALQHRVPECQCTSTVAIKHIMMYDVLCRTSAACTWLHLNHTGTSCILPQTHDIATRVISMWVQHVPDIVTSPEVQRTHCAVCHQPIKSIIITRMMHAWSRDANLALTGPIWSPIWSPFWSPLRSPPLVPPLALPLVAHQPYINKAHQVLGKETCEVC